MRREIFIAGLALVTHVFGGAVEIFYNTDCTFEAGSTVTLVSTTGKTCLPLPGVNGELVGSMQSVSSFGSIINTTPVTCKCLTAPNGARSVVADCTNGENFRRDVGTGGGSAVRRQGVTCPNQLRLVQEGMIWQGLTAGTTNTPVLVDNLSTTPLTGNATRTWNEGDSEGVALNLYENLSSAAAAAQPGQTVSAPGLILSAQRTFTITAELLGSLTLAAFEDTVSLGTILWQITAAVETIRLQPVQEVAWDVNLELDNWEGRVLPNSLSDSIRLRIQAMPPAVTDLGQCPSLFIGTIRGGTGGRGGSSLFRGNGGPGGDAQDLLLILPPNVIIGAIIGGNGGNGGNGFIPGQGGAPGLVEVPTFLAGLVTDGSAGSPGVPTTGNGRGGDGGSGGGIIIVAETGGPQGSDCGEIASINGGMGGPGAPGPSP